MGIDAAGDDAIPNRPNGTWLLRDDQVLATVEIASTRRARRRGLLGREAVDGALLLRPARSVHTFGMRFPIDVAHLDREGVVVRLTSMKPHRLGAYVHRARSVVECEAGSFARWGVRVGDRLEIR